MSNTPKLTIEYLYSTDYVYDDAGQFANRYPVQKSTARFLWIDHSNCDRWSIGQYYCPDDTEWQIRRHPEQRLCRIPIAELVENGCYYHRQSRKSYSLVLPEFWQRVVDGLNPQVAPPCFRFFGFEFRPTVKEFEKAYRKMSLSLHPDRGGEVKDFQLLVAEAENCRKYFEYEVAGE